MNWLLLRGLGREIRHWHQFPDFFTKANPHARVHVLDLPGFGREAKEQSPLTIEGNTDYLRRRWKHLRDQFSGSWGIVGTSMGGMIAMDWSARFPLDFERVVLINSSSRDLARPWERITMGGLRELAQILLHPSALERERRVLAVNTRLVSDLDELASQFALFSNANLDEGINLFRQLCAVVAFHKPAKIDVPILILKSAQDKLVNPLCSDRLRAHFRADLRTHLSAGHDLTLDDSEWTVARITEWSDELQRMTSAEFEGRLARSSS